MADLAESANLRYVHIEEGATIGEKRNFGSDLAHGELVISWDDDDWNAGNRIGAQIHILDKTRKSLSSFHSMLFTDGDLWWKFHGHPTSNLGTSLCYRRDWWKEHKFLSKQIGEDSEFIMMAARAGQHVSTDAGLLMVASIHSGNTSPRTLDRDYYKKIEDPKIEGYCEALK